MRHMNRTKEMYEDIACDITGEELTRAQIFKKSKSFVLCMGGYSHVGDPIVSLCLSEKGYNLLPEPIREDEELLWFVVQALLCGPGNGYRHPAPDGDFAEGDMGLENLWKSICILCVPPLEDGKRTDDVRFVSHPEARYEHGIRRYYDFAEAKDMIASHCKCTEPGTTYYLLKKGKVVAKGVSECFVVERKK